MRKFYIEDKMKNTLHFDIKKEDVYFVGDTHFSHQNIIKYDNRPFITKEEHDEKIIENWNNTVPKNSIVIHLGDVGFFKNPTDAQKIVNRLNGKIHLIEGNHDNKLRDLGIAGRFESISLYTKLIIEKGYNPQTLILFHYPLEEWEGKFRNFWHIHGHTHGNMNSIIKGRMEVSINLIDYKPIHYVEVERYMKNQK